MTYGVPYPLAVDTGRCLLPIGLNMLQQVLN